MGLLKILQYPDPRLKRVAVPVTSFDAALQQAIDDMFETHYHATNCAALAATQLDMDPPWRITVIDYSEQKNEPLCLVNPKIVACTGEQFETEGCMSVYPEHVHEKVKRYQTISVESLDRYGNEQNFEAEGFFAKCIQHEIDHLDGKTYLDRLPKLKKDRLLNKVKKAKRLLKQEKKNT